MIRFIACTVVSPHPLLDPIQRNICNNFTGGIMIQDIDPVNNVVLLDAMSDHQSGEAKTFYLDTSDKPTI